MKKILIVNKGIVLIFNKNEPREIREITKIASHFYTALGKLYEALGLKKHQKYFELRRITAELVRLEQKSRTGKMTGTEGVQLINTLNRLNILYKEVLNSLRLLPRQKNISPERIKETSDLRYHILQLAREILPSDIEKLQSKLKLILAEYKQRKQKN